MQDTIRDEDIAVIGLSGRFPGASSADELWNNSCLGLETIHHFSVEELRAHSVDPALLAHPHYIRSKGIVEQVDLFDADFFGMSDLDATLLDPQHRLFLLSAWEALEHAGYAPRNIAQRVGVFASTGMSLYLLNNILRNPEKLQTLDEYQVLLANDKDFLATRVSYLLNLKGPSLTIQTGCSSSLVCIHYAVQSLLNGECDMAIAGGVSLTIPQEQGYLYRKDMIGSSDGHCYAFDERAQGTVKSNGVGLVVLKPLKDAMQDQDTVYAVIRGSAINNDGSQKVGFTAPNASQQTAVIQEALCMADVESDSIGYIETHGTGTLLGDPIELTALKQAFSTQVEEKLCALVSLKTNLGHLDVAAGVASFIRACLALYHGKIPPSLHFSKLNSKISLDHSPFYINTELRDWPANQHPRRAGVSAFGVGGTNAHVILQEAPVYESRPSLDGPTLCVMSAQSRQALQRNLAQLITYCKKNPQLSLDALAYTLSVGREALSYRATFVVHTREELIEKAALTHVDAIHPVSDIPPLVFMFAGQGAQYPQMGYDLYHHDADFRQAFDDAMLAFSPHFACDLRAFIHPHDITPETATQLMQTHMAQPALFIIEYALAQSYMAKGFKPVALIGHSIGEYVAASLAGIFTLHDVAKLIAVRGKLVQSLPAGKMLAVQASPASLRAWLPTSVDIALENSPMNTVIAGTCEAMDALELLLKARHIRYQALHTSHAFHSRMLDPILSEFRHCVEESVRNVPVIPMVSNVTGTWLTEDQACSVDYWVQQLRQSVKFSQGISVIQKQFSPVFLEIGPGRTLQSILTQQGIVKVTNTLRHPLDEQDDRVQYAQTYGFLWQHGLSIPAPHKTRRIPLPTYSWDLKRYWISASTPDAKPIAPPVLQKKVDQSVVESVKMAWENALGVEPKAGHDHFFHLGGHSLSAIRFIDQLPDALKAYVQVVHLYQYPTYAQFLHFVTSLKHEESSVEDSMDSETLLFLEGQEL